MAEELKLTLNLIQKIRRLKSILRYQITGKPQFKASFSPEFKESYLQLNPEEREELKEVLENILQDPYRGTHIDEINENHRD